MMGENKSPHPPLRDTLSPAGGEGWRYSRITKRLGNQRFNRFDAVVNLGIRETDHPPT